MTVDPMTIRVSSFLPTATKARIVRFGGVVGVPRARTRKAATNLLLILFGKIIKITQFSLSKRLRLHQAGRLEGEGISVWLLCSILSYHARPRLGGLLRLYPPLTAWHRD